MDRRQRKTREAIFKAFTELLKEESYSKITVQQIIDLADIGRTTFYTHFETKDDVLRALCNAIFSHVFSDDPGKEKTHDFSASHNLESRVTHILYHLQEHISYLAGIMSGDGSDIFLDSFRGHLSELFAPATDALACNAPSDFVLNHLVNSFAEAVRWWTQYDNFAPEEISTFFFSLVPLHH